MKIPFLKIYFCLLALFCFTDGAFAQLYNCNGFLRGRYIEAGINWNGCFGSSTRPPAGYHADTLARLYNNTFCSDTLLTDTSLGFCADPGKDGWSIGSPPFFGDYVLPGTPNEGWSIQCLGTLVNVWNENNQFTDTLPHGTTSSVQSYIYDTAAHKQTVTSQAITVGGQVYVTEYISLDTNDLFVKVQVVIQNELITATDNIYYMRAINPHNDALQTGIMNTKQKINFQPDSAHFSALVSSTGTRYGNAYLALGSKDTTILPKAFIAKHMQMPDVSSMDAVFAGADTNYLYGVNDSITGNVAMGLVFNVGVIGAGSSASFTFYYSFFPSALDSALSIHATTTAIEDVAENTNAYTIFPNPYQRQFNINGLKSNDEVVLYEMTGRQILNALIRNGVNTFSESNLPSGAYFILIKDAYGNVTGKIAVVKE